VTNENKTTLRRWFAAGWLAAAISCLAVADSRCQQFPVGGSATDFSAVQYFEAPHPLQIKSRLSGAQAQPLPGGLLLIKQIKLETFETNGSPQLIANAPECIYNPSTGVANSPGEVHMRTGSGQLRMDGQGFLWQERESFLTISNRIQTILERTPIKAR